MATQVQTPAAESKPPQHKEVENFSDAERTEWLKTGKMPALETGSSSEADASAASKPASKTDNGDGGKESGSGPGKKARSQDENWRALEAERDSHKSAREAAEKKAQEVERELEEYRTGKRKPEEKKADATTPKLLEMPVRPKMKDHLDANGTLDSEKYEAALDKYEEQKTAYTNQQVQVRTAQQQQEASLAKWTGDINAKYGDKASGLDVKKTVDSLAATMQTAPAFFMVLNDSEVFTDLVFVLGTDPKLDELLAEAKDPKTGMKAVRKLIAFENGVKEELAKQAKTEPLKKEEKLTRAGKPPSEAAGAVSSPADDGSSEAALRRKDLSADERGELYRERKNKEDREKRKKKVN